MVSWASASCRLRYCGCLVAPHVVWRALSSCRAGVAVALVAPRVVWQALSSCRAGVGVALVAPRVVWRALSSCRAGVAVALVAPRVVWRALPSCRVGVAAAVVTPRVVSRGAVIVPRSVLLSSRSTWHRGRCHQAAWCHGRGRHAACSVTVVFVAPCSVVIAVAVVAVAAPRVVSRSRSSRCIVLRSWWLSLPHVVPQLRSLSSRRRGHITTMLLGHGGWTAKEEVGRKKKKRKRTSRGARSTATRCVWPRGAERRDARRYGACGCKETARWGHVRIDTSSSTTRLRRRGRR
jgi:predicted DNA-binding protein (UPF0251 family)